jgi:hypothetical protein
MAAGDVTTAMVARVNFYIENEGTNQTADTSQIIISLNRAQQEFMRFGFRKPNTIPELDVTDTSIAIDSNSEVDLSTALSQTMYQTPNGLLSVRITSGQYGDLISETQIKDLTNGLGGNTSEPFILDPFDPKYTIKGKTLHWYPEVTDASDTLDFHYIREPVTIATNVDCELKKDVRDSLEYLAAGIHLNTVQEFDAANRMFQFAEGAMSAIFGQFPKTGTAKFAIPNIRISSGLQFQPGARGAFFVGG